MGNVLDSENDNPDSTTFNHLDHYHPPFPPLPIQTTAISHIDYCNSLLTSLSASILALSHCIEQPPWFYYSCQNSPMTSNCPCNKTETHYHSAQSPMWFDPYALFPSFFPWPLTTQSLLPFLGQTRLDFLSGHLWSLFYVGKVVFLVFPCINLSHHSLFYSTRVDFPDHQSL